MTMTQILERLRTLSERVDDALDDSNHGEIDALHGSLDALILDIEIHCTRTGVPLV